MKSFAVITMLLTSAPASAQSASSASATARGVESVPAVTTTTDYVIVEGQWDRLVLAPGGGTGSVDWLRTTPGASAYTGGVSATTMIDSQWILATGGMALRPTEAVILHAQTRIGGGRTAGAPFVYRMQEAGLAYRAAARVYVTFDEQYLHVGETWGYLIKPGLAF